MMSRTSPSTRAASAALARPGPIAAATSAGVEPSGISFTDPSGSAILSILVMWGGSSRAEAPPQPSAQPPLAKSLKTLQLQSCSGERGFHGCNDSVAGVGRRPRDPLYRQLARISADCRDQRAADHLHAGRLSFLGGCAAAPLFMVAHPRDRRLSRMD